MRTTRPAGYRLLLLLMLLNHLAAHPGEDTHADHHGHHHELHQAEAPIPELNVSVERDAVGGWNAQLKVRHFSFAPQAVNQAHRPGHGHAHIYVDGEKFARLYGPWFHIPALGPGRHELRFTLNTNDHREYGHDGKPIETIVVVESRPRKSGH